MPPSGEPARRAREHRVAQRAAASANMKAQFARLSVRFGGRRVGSVGRAHTQLLGRDPVTPAFGQEPRDGWRTGNDRHYRHR